jgi:hypothetical protein
MKYRDLMMQMDHIYCEADTGKLYQQANYVVTTLWLKCGNGGGGGGVNVVMVGGRS